MWPASCSISSLSSSSSCSCWALWEREPRADLELQRALPTAATRPRRQNENPARVWHLKREVARAGSRESSGGLGERGLHQAKHPAGGKYSAREGRYAGLFAVRLRVCAGLALDQSFYCDLRRIFRAPSQSLSGSRSPSLASSMTNLASTTTNGS